MAIYPKIADNEMNYFQFKAKQMLLLKKEDREWQDFCKQIAPECAACLAEKTDFKESKDIGIQAFPRRLINKTERPSLQPNYQNEQIPEALNNIKTRLEKIDLALSKLYDVPYESEKERKPTTQQKNYIPATPIFYKEQTLKPFEEQRKLLIQNSLRSSLQKLHDSGSVIPRKPSVIKPKNSSYFLPHDLQVKRAASRKAYLASLQTKPKVSFQSVRQNSDKNLQTSPNKKSIPKHVSKLRKKPAAKKVVKESVDKEETLIQAFAADDTKDDNIESVVDAILDDLLGEATLDLNKIKQKKRERHSNMPNKKTDEKEIFIPLSSLTSTPIKSTDPKVTVSDDNKSITKLKLFIDSSEKILPEDENLRKELLIDKSTSTFHIEDSKAMHEEIIAEKSFIGTSRLKRNYEIKKAAPKFVCDVSHIITIDPKKAKDISHNRDRFWRYLKNISRTVKGNFNPWILNEMLAESILDDCINDIATELNELPSNFVQDLYNQEFVQQVEN